MYRWAELHNHTNQSDGNLSVEDLLDLAEDRDFSSLAITDHNTLSGIGLARKIIEKKAYDLNLIQGIEITTNYGHILALGIEEMIDICGQDVFRPGDFFDKIRANGARAIGLAHPFAMKRPITTGAHYAMSLDDLSPIDYIEIYNGTEEFSSPYKDAIGNERALYFWEDSFLADNNLAATAGKDIHSIPENKHLPVTFYKDYGLSPEENIYRSIGENTTQVSLGPILGIEEEGETLIVKIDNSSRYFSWNEKYREYSYILYVKDGFGIEKVFPIEDPDKSIKLTFSDLSKRYIFRLYKDEVAYENLLAMGISYERRDSK